MVGRLGRTRGRLGELKAVIYSTQAGRAERLGDVKLQKGPHARITRVESVWLHDGTPVVKLAGIDSISEAEAWEGADILVPAADLVRPEAGEYLHSDLIGCTVWDEGKNRPLGAVRGVQEYGGAPLLEVDADGREVLVPLAHSICREIDITHKIIRAKLPEGLTEL